MANEIKKENTVDATKLNIFQKLSKITEELGFVKKNLDVNLPNGKYKAVGEVDVLESVKPLENKYGVYSYPQSRQIIVDKETTTKSGTINQFIRIETVYRFVNIDNPSEFIDITTYGDGLDSGDKAPGKGMTYADKYALLKAYKISTGDDPDQNASEEQSTTKRNTQAKATANQIDNIKELVDYDADKIYYILDQYKVKGLLDLTSQQASEIVQRIKAKKIK